MQTSLSLKDLFFNHTEVKEGTSYHSARQTRIFYITLINKKNKRRMKMSKRILALCVVFLLGIVVIGCSKKPPPYDARAIDESEVDTPAQNNPPPATGGGKALKRW